MQEENQSQDLIQKKKVTWGHIIVLVLGLFICLYAALPELADGAPEWNGRLELCIYLLCTLVFLRVIGSIFVKEKKFPWWFYMPFIGLSYIWINWIISFLIWHY